MKEHETSPVHDRWAQFRLKVVGHLLACPPGEKGELRRELERLAAKTWSHPVTGEPATFGFSTIERWYYRARKVADAVAALRKKVRSDQGTRPSVTEATARAIESLYRDHPGWTKQLHHDNLVVLCEEDALLLSPLPSYSSVCRYMADKGMKRRKCRKDRDTEGFRRAVERLEEREVRSYEATHVNALWHMDFHHGGLKVLTPRGEWVSPILYGVIDDRSRLICHMQWYYQETAENLVHGLTQAILKRGLPRVDLMDNGSAMVAAETKEGHRILSVQHETTLAYSPYQNGKQENLWAFVEGRLVPMLEGVKDLTLRTLNEATQAWAEVEYNRRHHSELGTTPLERFLAGPDVSRESPSTEELRLAFMRVVTRSQRRSDGTILLEGIRFEVPSRFRHLRRLAVRYASFDLANVFLWDPVGGKVLSRLYPLDKAANADGRRRALLPTDRPATAPAGEPGMAPLMKKLLAEYSATGLPFGYLQKDEEGDEPGVQAVLR